MDDDVGIRVFGARSASRPATPRWVFVCLGLGALGLVLWGARWVTQGADTLYTDTARVFWVSGPRGAWVETRERWVWLGLEGFGAVLAVVLSTLGALWLAGRARHPTLATTSKVLSRLGAAFAMNAPLLPAWAFISGMPPDGAERLLPLASVDVERLPTRMLSPVDLPTGTWTLVDSADNVLTARVSAGGETFDARFGPVTAAVQIDAELARSRARMSVPASSVDTGIPLRNSHARRYLAADQHPSIDLAIDQLTVVGPGADAESRAFEAVGALSFMGAVLTTTVTGTLAPLAEEDRVSLGIASPLALLVNASFVLPVEATPLDPDNFDSARIPVNARLVISPTPR